MIKQLNYSMWKTQIKPKEEKEKGGKRKEKEDKEKS